MFSTGGSTLSVDKIKPVETRACEGVLVCIENKARQVVHMGMGLLGSPGCNSVPAKIGVAHFLVDQQLLPGPGHANLPVDHHIRPV